MIPVVWASWNEMRRLGGVAPHHFRAGEDKVRPAMLCAEAFGLQVWATLSTKQDPATILVRTLRAKGRPASYTKLTNLMLFEGRLQEMVEGPGSKGPNVKQVPPEVALAAQQLLCLIPGAQEAPCSRLGCKRRRSLGAGASLCAICRVPIVASALAGSAR